MCETQTCKNSRVDLNPCTNEGIIGSKTHIKMVLVGQPKHKTILENKMDIHITGNIKYKVSQRN